MHTTPLQHFLYFIDIYHKLVQRIREVKVAVLIPIRKQIFKFEKYRQIVSGMGNKSINLFTLLKQPCFHYFVLGLVNADDVHILFVQ